MPRKKDAWIILVALAIAGGLLLFQTVFRERTRDLSQYMAETTAAPDAMDEAPAQKEAPAQAQSEAFGPALPPPSEPIAGYVLIGVAGKQYGDPIPMDREKTITIRQERDKVNEIYITPSSVAMHSSTCENQDCVGQGEITTDNYTTRILSTFILCLPNEVSIEFIPAQNVEEANGP